MPRLLGSIVIAAAVITLSSTLTGCGDDIESAREYVHSTYTRVTARDQVNDGRAYTSTLAPTAVTGAIAGAHRPLDNRSAGGRHYLQYRDDIISVAPDGAGSLVLVDQYRNGYTRHQSTVSPWGWANTPPGEQYRSESGK